MTAFDRADAGFTAADEPSSISTWRDEMVQMPDDLGIWIQAAVDWRFSQWQPSAAYRAAVAAVQEDLSTCDTDTRKVAAGR